MLHHKLKGEEEGKKGGKRGGSEEEGKGGEGKEGVEKEVNRTQLRIYCKGGKGHFHGNLYTCGVLFLPRLLDLSLATPSIFSPPDDRDFSPSKNTESL